MGPQHSWHKLFGGIMANFATESGVRLKFQVEDTTQFPTTLVEGSIDDAHDEMLRWLDPDVDTQSPPTGLVVGETLLAGSYLLTSLASRSAVERQQVVVAGQRIESGDRFSSLIAMASRVEKQAWRTLDPFLAARPGRVLVDTTDTVPVLGEVAT